MAIDNDPEILEFFNEIAHNFDISCDTALSEEEALTLVEQNGPYQIYFLDWKMPGINGIQLAGKLKTWTPANSVIVMIPAAEWDTVAEEAKQAGVDKILFKPLFPSTIVDILNMSLGYSNNNRKTEKTVTNTAGLFEGRRILLAEDVEINREIVMSILEPTHLEIDCAENGIEAVNMYSNSPEKYDLIFMDLQMPEMDGYEATRNIRLLNFPDAKTIPIIAMTANAFQEDIEKCLEAGMNSHLGKPLELEKVIDKLRFYLPKKHNPKPALMIS